MRTTIQHIADELNLTAATVSRALRDHPRISIETKQLVNATAERLNYHRNKIASSLRTGKSNTIGVIIPSARINFFGSVVHGIETIASEFNYHTLIYQSEERTELEKKAIEAFLGARVDGILASMAKETSDFSHFSELKKKNIPLVLFDRVNDSLNIPSVVVDDFKGGYAATEHLIKQGYQRIGHLAGPPAFQTFQNRLAGYLSALKKYDRPIDESLIYTGDLSIDAGRMAADYYLNLPERPDAIFSVEDFSALGLMKRFKERGIHIPAEMGLIGFANEEFDEHLSPGLSSMDQQTAQMGREAFTLLLQLIERKKEKSGIASKIVLDPVPFFRESSVRDASAVSRYSLPNQTRIHSKLLKT